MVAFVQSCVIVAAAFVSALPVWRRDVDGLPNDNLQFEGNFCLGGSQRAVLRIASAYPFKIELNRSFVGYGPARGPEGFFRVDEWPLDAHPGTNMIFIMCTDYGVRTFCFMKQKPFLQAEVLVDGRPCLSTQADGMGFAAFETGRIRKVNRYSYQRGFGEAYDVPGADRTRVPLARTANVHLLPRRIPFPAFDVMDDFIEIRRGLAAFDHTRKIRPVRFVATTGPDGSEGYEEKELEVNLWNLQQQFAADAPEGSDSYVLYDSPCNRTGFLAFTVECRQPGELVVFFDEILIDGRLEPMRSPRAANAILWRFARPGIYEVEAFEPNTLKAVAAVTRGGDLKVSRPRLRLYRNAKSRAASFRCGDVVLERLFVAAEETFAQNAVDIFMDCPGRERAGWLCDSFFTARTGTALTGMSDFETLFLENFALPEKFVRIPDGMLPMCYPADILGGRFIPSWAMFLVLELEEYATLRGGDAKLVGMLKPRVQEIISALKRYRNKDGLLERLPGWVFVEWSKANELTQDVNYPNNMVWAATLRAAARLYGWSELADEALRVQDAIRAQSRMDSGWYCDNAVRDADGVLHLSGERTEVCQYYAFQFGTATPDRDPDLWRSLVEDFSPRHLQKPHTAHPEVHPANIFIGDMLRLEMLSHWRLDRQVLDELRCYFGKMADLTGTFWEHDTPKSSCNHGFAGHVAVFLLRNALGLRMVDYHRRFIVFEPPNATDLPGCEVRIPIQGETMCFAWQSTKEGVRETKCELPPGWRRISSCDADATEKGERQ